MRAVRGTLVCLVGLTLCLAPVPLPAQQPRAERPTYSIGEQWIRSDGTYVLVRIEGDRYIFVADGGREIHLSMDLTIAKIMRGGPIPIIQWEFDPPVPLQWPLEVGKWGTKLVTYRPPRSPGGMSSTITWSVDSYEEVRVRAGTFKAFKVRFLIEFKTITWISGSRELVLWYAPDARQFVKGEGADMGNLNFQVVAVVSGPASPQAVEALPAPPVGGSPLVTEPPDLSIAAAPAPSPPPAASPSPPAPAPSPAPATPAPQPATPMPPSGRPTAGLPPPALSAPQAPVGPPEAPPSKAAVVPPLKVSVATPQDQTRVDQEMITLAGLVSGGAGVGQVLVTLNGAEVARREKQTPSLSLSLPLTLREGQNTLVVTASAADGTTLQEVRTIYYSKAAPLAIDFRFPADQARLVDAGTVVVALATSGKGVAQVQVTLNGVEVYQQSEPRPQRSVAVTTPVTLREGPNAIIVTAREPDGTVRQEVRTVTYNRPKVAAAPPPPPLPMPDRWAVVIGIGNYESPGIPKLRYAVPDAEAIYQMLTGPAGFKKERVVLLTDKTERKPTLRNLRWALGTFLARSAKKDDIVVIFFAGHGAPEPDPRGLERDGLAKYLIPVDADPDDLYASALPMDELQTIFGRIEAERVVLFVDACYSGAAGGRTFASRKTRDINVDSLFLERLTRARGRAILTASRPAEVSVELPELGHGLFTYYLLQGLNGAADFNRDRIVTLQELYEYVEQQVSQKARALGANQHPVMKGELEGVLPLMKVTSK